MDLNLTKEKAKEKLEVVYEYLDAHSKIPKFIFDKILFDWNFVSEKDHTKLNPEMSKITLECIYDYFHTPYVLDTGETFKMSVLEREDFEKIIEEIREYYSKNKNNPIVIKFVKTNNR